MDGPDGVSAPGWFSFPTHIVCPAPLAAFIYSNNNNHINKCCQLVQVVFMVVVGGALDTLKPRRFLRVDKAARDCICHSARRLTVRYSPWLLPLTVHHPLAPVSYIIALLLLLLYFDIPTGFARAGPPTDCITFLIYGRCASLAHRRRAYRSSIFTDARLRPTVCISAPSHDLHTPK